MPRVIWTEEPLAEDLPHRWWEGTNVQQPLMGWERGDP